MLDLSMSPLCKAVRRVTCFVQVLHPKFASTLDEFRIGLNLKSPSIHELFEEYCRRVRYQKFLKYTGLDIKSLWVAIVRFQNLRAVQISQDWSADWFCESNGEEEMEHFSTYSFGTRTFDAVTIALAASNTGIKDLTLGEFDGESTYTWVPSLVSTVQALTPARLQLYQRAFGKLRRLKIVLPWLIQGDYQSNFGGLSALIQSASLLEELWLTFDNINVYPLQHDFLNTLELSYLKTLALHSISFQDPPTLLSFLGRLAGTLKSLTCFHLSLKHGSWETVFLGLRDILTLVSGEMGGPFLISCDIEGIYIKEIGGYKCMVPSGTIEGFIQRRTHVNPFDFVRSTGLAEKRKEIEFQPFQDASRLPRV